MNRIEEIADRSGLDDILESSDEAPVWLFKHSLTCGTSSWAFKQFRRFVADRPADETGRFAMLPVQSARAVSDALASTTGVRHESPQVLLLRGSRVLWHTSHWQITEAALEEAARTVLAQSGPEVGSIGV